MSLTFDARGHASLLPGRLRPSPIHRRWQGGSPGLPASTGSDWVAALEALFADPGVAKRMGAEGRRIVGQHFSVEAAAGKLAAVFREIAGR